MGMEILFSIQQMRWDGINILMIDLYILNSTNKSNIDVFAIALSTMKIIDAKYEKAD
jgi:hypothetical protein